VVAQIGGAEAAVLTCRVPHVISVNENGSKNDLRTKTGTKMIL